MKIKKQNNLTKHYLQFLLAVVLLVTSCHSEGAQFKQGKKLYGTHCESCHMEDGTGLGANIPPLAASDYLKERQEHIICIIRHGLSDTISVNGIIYTEQMAAIPQLSEFEIANIINYINQDWGNNFGFVNVKELRVNLDKCP